MTFRIIWGIMGDSWGHPVTRKSLLLSCLPVISIMVALATRMATTVDGPATTVDGPATTIDRPLFSTTFNLFGRPFLLRAS